jgi:protein-disulfide isomerase
MLKRLAAVAVVALLGFASSAQAQEEQPLSQKQQDAVKKIVREYIMANPEIIRDAIEALREKQRLEAEEEARKALVERGKEIFEDPDSPVLGNPQGDVTLVEFFDYRCTYCKGVAEAMFSIAKADGKLRLVFKELPILGPESVYAAKAALAARAQNKYEDFHRAMMKVRGVVNEDTILKTAQSVGLDVEKLKKDMTQPAVEDQLKRNMELARSLDINGTPAFIIGDRIIPGVVDADTMKKLIEQSRKPTELIKKN